MSTAPDGAQSGAGSVQSGLATIAEGLCPVKPGPPAWRVLEALVAAGERHSFALESGPGTGGRWSVVGTAPDAMVVIGATSAVDPFVALAGFVAAPGLHVVMLSYELGRHVERLPGRAREDLGLPRLWCARYGGYYLRDEHTGGSVVVTGEGGGRRAGALAEALRHAAATRKRSPAEPPRCGAVTTSLDAPTYRAAVARIREYLLAGDVYQVNLARRLSVDTEGDDLSTSLMLYRRLHHSHPARYGAWVDLGGAAVVSNSPERLLLRVGDEVLSEPIKGTCARDADPATALTTDEKQRAEHVMIVDLVRNDLGRVARAGSVRVPSLMRVETLPTLRHMVSTVTARLRPDVGLAELLRAVFPGGSVTGAPKVRAMEVIDELEPVARGVYCGALGFIANEGRTLELNLPIRTATCVGGRVHFPVGGGIVADSDPEAELAETHLKARAFLRALGAPDADAVFR